MHHSANRAIYSSSTGIAHGFPVHASLGAKRAVQTTTQTAIAPSTSLNRSVIRRAANPDSTVSRKSPTVKDDLPDTPPPASPMDSIVVALDDITGQ